MTNEQKDKYVKMAEENKNIHESEIQKIKISN